VLVAANQFQGTVTRMISLRTALRTRVHWILGTVLFLAALWAHVIPDPGWGTYVVAGNDIAYDMPWILEMMRGGAPVVFGHTAGFGGGHPGPSFLWLFAMGYALGEYAGAYLLITVVILLVWALAAVGLARAVGTPLAGYALVTALALGDHFEWPMPSASQTWLIGPVLSFALLLASICAMAATPARWRWSAPVALSAGLLATSIYVNVGPLALLPMLTGGYWLVRDRRLLGRGPVFATAASLALVVLPLLVRWWMWGVSFPLDYVRNMIAFRANNEGGRLGEAVSTLLPNVWFGLPGQLAVTVWVLVVLAPAVAALKASWRARALRLFVIAVGTTVFTLTVPSLSEPHISAIGTLLPKIAFAFLVGAVVLAVTRMLSKTRLVAGTVVGTVVSAVVGVALAGTAVSLFANESSTHNRFHTSMQHSPAVQEAAARLYSVPQTAEILRGKEVVMDEWSEGGRLNVALTRPLRVELRRTGSDVCTSGTAPGRAVGGSLSNEMRCEFAAAARYALLVGQKPGPDVRVVDSFDVRIGGTSAQVSLIEIPR
jgi:hypothetical protein